MTPAHNPEAHNQALEGRREFLEKLAATVAVGTASLASQTLAQEVGDESSSQNAPIPVSDDTEGHSIDNLPISQQIEAIDAEIAEIQTQLDKIAAKETLETSDRRERSRLRRRLAELENQQSQLIEQQRAENEAAISERKDQLIDEFAEKNGELDS